MDIREQEEPGKEISRERLTSQEVWYCMKCGKPKQYMETDYFDEKTGQKTLWIVCMTHGCRNNSLCYPYFCEFGFFGSSCKRCGKKRSD